MLKAQLILVTFSPHCATAGANMTERLIPYARTMCGGCPWALISTIKG